MAETYALTCGDIFTENGIVSNCLKHRGRICGRCKLGNCLIEKAGTVCGDCKHYNEARGDPILLNSVLKIINTYKQLNINASEKYIKQLNRRPRLDEQTTSTNYIDKINKLSIEKEKILNMLFEEKNHTIKFHKNYTIVLLFFDFLGVQKKKKITNPHPKVCCSIEI